MHTIAIYTRKSKLSDKGESLQNQATLCKEYGKLHFDTNNFIIYKDEGFSGGNADRPQFRKMIKDMKNKKFDVLICYRIDRISRNIIDFSHLVELLQQYNITFVSLKEQFDTSTPIGRAMMYIALVFAQLERETIAERIRDNMLELARTGRWLGGVTPTGFTSKPITYYDNHMNKKQMYQLVPLHEELEIVKILYEKYLVFNSLTQLESWCLENNLKTKNNKNFDRSSLKKILTNPVYAIADQQLYQYFTKLGVDIASHKNRFDGSQGVLVYNKNQEKKGQPIKMKDYVNWIVAISQHKGIISSADWIKTQELLKKNSKKAPRSGSSQIGLLTPLLVCGYCGSKLKVTYKVSKGKVLHHYYKCTLKEKSRGSLCKIQNLNGKEVEEFVINQLKEFSLVRHKLLKALHSKRSSFLELPKNQQNERDLLIKKLVNYQKKISSLTLKLAEAEGSILHKYMITEIEGLHEKITSTKKQLEALTSDEEDFPIENIKAELVKQALTDFPTQFAEADFQEKKRILQILIKDILWDGEKLHINIYDANTSDQRI